MHSICITGLAWVVNFHSLHPNILIYRSREAAYPRFKIVRFIEPHPLATSALVFLNCSCALDLTYLSFRHWKVRLHIIV